MPEIIQRIAMKAVISDKNGRVLILKIADTSKAGPNAGKYGLPGGKIKAGEAWDEGLIREVKEETGLTVQIGRVLSVGEWRPQVGDVRLQIIGVFFECTTEDRDITLSEENDSYVWANQKDLNTLAVLSPDKEVALNYLVEG